jgi:hypothetical protein
MLPEWLYAFFSQAWVLLLVYNLYYNHSYFSTPKKGACFLVRHIRKQNVYVQIATCTILRTWDFVLLPLFGEYYWAVLPYICFACACNVVLMMMNNTIFSRQLNAAHKELVIWSNIWNCYTTPDTVAVTNAFLYLESVSNNEPLHNVFNDDRNPPAKLVVPPICVLHYLYVYAKAQMETNEKHFAKITPDDTEELKKDLEEIRVWLKTKTIQIFSVTCLAKRLVLMRMILLFGLSTLSYVSIKNKKANEVAMKQSNWQKVKERNRKTFEHAKTFKVPEK